jgi:hypothetical protein
MNTRKNSAKSRPDKMMAGQTADLSPQCSGVNQDGGLRSASDHIQSSLASSVERGDHPVALATCCVCKKEVSKAQAGLKCDCCKLRHHNDCELIDLDTYNFIQNHPNSKVHWYSQKCDNSVVKIMQVVSNLSARQDSLEKKMQELVSDVNDSKAQSAQVSASVNLVSEKVDDLATSVDDVMFGLDDVQRRLDGNMDRMYVDILDLDRRKENIMVFGTKECTESEIVRKKQFDKDTVHKVACAMGLDNIDVVAVRRLGQKKDVEKVGDGEGQDPQSGGRPILATLQLQSLQC